MRLSGRGFAGVWQWLGLAAVCAVCAAGAARAEEDPGAGTPPGKRTPLPDRLQPAIGNRLRTLADRLDRFFSDEVVEEELQDSRIRLGPSVEWSRGGARELSFPVRLHLALPRLENRVQLFLDRWEDQWEDADDDTRGSDARRWLDWNEPDRSTRLGLQFSPVTQLRQHLKFTGGVRLSSGELDPYVSTRFRRSVPFDIWTLRFTQSVFWYREDGVGETTRVEFLRPLGERLDMRTVSAATWSETSRGVDLRQALVFRRWVAEGQAVALALSAAGHTRPTTVADAYAMSVEYRRLIYRDWVFLRLVPEARFPRDRDYAFTPFLVTALEMVF